MGLGGVSFTKEKRNGSITVEKSPILIQQERLRLICLMNSMNRDIRSNPIGMATDGYIFDCER